MRLIDADALVSALNNGRLKEQTGRAVPFNAGVAFALTMVEYAQTIDPVRHGRWITEPYMDNFITCRCSECMTASAVTSEDNKSRFNYCPNCGAKMDEEE